MKKWRGGHLEWLRTHSPSACLADVGACQKSTRQSIGQLWGRKFTLRLNQMLRQGFSGDPLVFFNLPDNLTVAHDLSKQLCYGRRRQSHWSAGGNRADSTGTRQSEHLLTRPTQTLDEHQQAQAPQPPLFQQARTIGHHEHRSPRRKRRT